MKRDYAHFRIILAYFYVTKVYLFLICFDLILFIHPANYKFAGFPARGIPLWTRGTPRLGFLPFHHHHISALTPRRPQHHPPSVVDNDNDLNPGLTTTPTPSHSHLGRPPRTHDAGAVTTLRPHSASSTAPSRRRRRRRRPRPGFDDNADPCALAAWTSRPTPRAIVDAQHAHTAPAPAVPVPASPHALDVHNDDVTCHVLASNTTPAQRPRRLRSVHAVSTSPTPPSPGPRLPCGVHVALVRHVLASNTTPAQRPRRPRGVHIALARPVLVSNTTPAQRPPCSCGVHIAELRLRTVLVVLAVSTSPSSATSWRRTRRLRSVHIPCAVSVSPTPPSPHPHCPQHASWPDATRRVHVATATSYCYN